MIIKNIQIRNFRNLSRVDFCPRANINILLGENGQGKTNFLEAICTAATGNSFRTASNTDMIQYEKEEMKIYLKYIREEREAEAYFSYNERGNKEYRINTVKVNKKNTDRLNVVLFTPEDLYIVKGNPKRRRKYLDFLMKQISPEYLYHLERYYEILKKRNLTLKKENNDKIYSAVSQNIFIDLAAVIIFFRINIINLIDTLAAAIHQRISGENDSIKIRYALSFPVQSDKISIEVLKESLGKRLEEIKNKEIYKRTTLVGPHLDDIHIYHHKRSAKKFSSQGQQRNISIALKLAEIEIYEKIKGEYPVLLMDEVLAELDDERKKMLLEYLKSSVFQTFITAVDIKELELPPNLVNLVVDGQITKQ